MKVILCIFPLILFIESVTRFIYNEITETTGCMDYERVYDYGREKISEVVSQNRIRVR